MVVVARYIGFFISAIWVQISIGVGLVALLAAIAIGWFRFNFLWIAVPVIGGAGFAHFLFEDVSTGGKVVNAMSNLAVEFIVYLAICVIGFAIGAVARRFR
jgi:hypothetical protein